MPKDPADAAWRDRHNKLQQAGHGVLERRPAEKDIPNVAWRGWCSARECWVSGDYNRLVVLKSLRYGLK